jgi:hypothetical protein
MGTRWVVQLGVESKPEDSEAAGSKIRIPEINFWCRGMNNCGTINTSTQTATVIRNKTICIMVVQAHVNLELRQPQRRICLP